MRLIFKAVNVKNPGAHGAPFWIDAKGNARYDEKPSEAKRPYKYVAIIVLSDGSKAYIKPNDKELDDEGQLKGGQTAVRDIVNRELFGEYGFKEDGTFWKKKGLLFDYKTRTAANGKVVVDAVQLHDGYQSIEFRDSSVSRAYGKGLPAKITKYLVAPSNIDPRTGETEGLPRKPDEAPIEGTSDVPVDEMGMHNVPKRLPQTHVAIGEALKNEEDPIAIASAYLSVFLEARKPSQAKTPEGRAKARAERKGHYDEIVGKRSIQALPSWAINKFDSAAELQHELGRANTIDWTEASKEGIQQKHSEGGHPLTTLITLGLWDPQNKNKRFREQLLKEWTPFLRQQARRYANVYSGTDAFRKFGEGVDKNAWLRDRERDLYNHGVAVLLHEADTYVSNDEPDGPYSRFDKKAKNAIKQDLKRMSREAAFELEHLRSKTSVKTMRITHRRQFLHASISRFATTDHKLDAS